MRAFTGGSISDSIRTGELVRAKRSARTCSRTCCAFSTLPRNGSHESEGRHSLCAIDVFPVAAETCEAAALQKGLETKVASIRVPFRICRQRDQVNVARLVRALEPIERRRGFAQARV